LERLGQLGDLIEEERATMRSGDEEALLRLRRAGEGPGARGRLLAGAALAGERHVARL
jgi:hypothetical protein